MQIKIFAVTEKGVKAMPNDMKYRLRELIDEAETKWWLNVLNEDPPSEFIADDLIENGVICPPCKVGDITYTIGKFTGQILPNEIVSIGIGKNDLFLYLESLTVVSVTHQLGKTVFLTKEEAEEKLKECSNNGC